MKNLIDQSGLVAGSDYLSLTRTTILQDEHLIDEITGAKHRLHMKAIKLLELLEWPIPYS